jgi:hypothetical protein
MADVFLSYASADRAVAAQVARALAEDNLTVFWDQLTPVGEDWDAYIRRNLSEATVVLVLWSKASVASPNVRHEVAIAREAGKLIPVMIERLAASEFPMGFFAVQSISLVGWNGDANAPQMLASRRNRGNAVA